MKKTEILGFFKAFLMLAMAFCFFFIMPQNSAYAQHDSLLEFTNGSDGTDWTKVSGIVDGIKLAIKTIINCYWTSAMFSRSDFKNTCIPAVIGDNIPPCKLPDTDPKYSSESMLDVIAKYIIILTACMAIPFLGEIIFYIFVRVELIMMLEACFAMYAVTPAEYVNMNGSNGKLACIQTGDGYIYDDSKTPPSKQKFVYTEDVPYFYTCTPPDGQSSDNVSTGYVGSDSDMCIPGGTAEYAVENLKTPMPDGQKTLVGTIIINRANLWHRFVGDYSNQKSVCDATNGSGATVSLALHGGQAGIIAKNGTMTSKMKLQAFYRFHVGRIQLCAASVQSIIPVVVGCTYVPPPQDLYDIDQSLKDWMEKVGCSYFLPSSNGREDLKAVAKMLNSESSGKKSSVYFFLMSDMHFTSDIIGCIESLLIFTFVTPGQFGDQSTDSFMRVIQNRMSSVVYAILLLYITLLGIQIGASKEVPPKSQWIMYLVKVVLVVYFATSNVWSGSNGRDGLYSVILDTTQVVSDLFIQVVESSDPIGMCTQYFQQGDQMVNILSQREVVVDGYAKGPVQMRVWDYLDCTLINYLNFGTCKYSIGGFLSFWFVPAALLSGGSGILLAIIVLVYAIMISLILFRFAHITILAMFILTILVLIAPLMVCAFLFEYTKGMGESWAKNILGYTLYPGMLFAFFTLMLTTFNMIFYGKFDAGTIEEIHACRMQADQSQCQIKVMELCGDGGGDTDNSGSLYCTIMKAIGNAEDFSNCSISLGHISNALTKTVSWPVLGTFTILQDPRIMVMPVLKLALFGLLFYFFMSAMESLVASTVGVGGLGNMAGAGTALGQAVSGASQAPYQVNKAIGKAALKIASLMKGGGGGSSSKTK